MATIVFLRKQKRTDTVRPVLILSFSDLANDPRVNRQIGMLARNFRVLVAGLAHPQVDRVEYFAIPPSAPRTISGNAWSALLLKLGQYERYYWSQPQVRWCLSALANVRPAVIIANDLSTLPLALKLTSAFGVIFDAHEYSPREFEDRFTWRVFFQGYNDYLCRKYLGRAAGMITVCQSIADEYRANYGVASEVLMNAPPFHDLKPGRSDADSVRMVHHGGAIPSRKIELMIEVMDHLDARFHLDLMLVPTDTRYLERLRSIASRYPRVRIVPPVPMRELPRHLNRYDIGLFLLPPTNFNYRYALPNKFFEFVQARLAVAIGPSPEMARLVRQYDCGIVSDDFSASSLAKLLNELDHERIGYYKQRADLAARDLCSERNSTVLLNMVNRLVGSD